MHSLKINTIIIHMTKEKESTLFYIMEPTYITPFWFSQSIQGIIDSAAKKKTTVVEAKSLSDIDSDAKSIVIIGNTKNWLRENISLARQRNFKIVLLGAIPDKYGEDISGTMYGGRFVIEQMVRYFYFHGRKHIALIDINSNSTNDVTKFEAFLSATKELGLDTSYSDVYFSNTDTHNPTENFLKRIDEYDGVICSNDYTAAYLLTYAREHSIKVPQQLFVAGLGDIMLSRYTNPSLTSATRSYYEAGEQIFSIWRTLDQNPNIVSIVSTMKSTIKPRGSTAFAPVLEEKNETVVPHQLVEKKDVFIPKVKQGTDMAKTVQDCLSQCDALDMKIIVGVVSNQSNETLAEKLDLAPGTINYRLKKLYKNAGVGTKTEFAELFKHFISVETLTKDTHGMR